MRHGLGWSLLLVVASCLVLPGHLRAGDRDGLITRIREASGKFRPITAPEVAQRKARLRVAIGRLERFLGGTSTSNREAWKSYLHWEQMQRELQQDQPNMAVMQQVGGKFTADFQGLEMSVYSDVRDRLRDYMNGHAFSQDPNFEQSYEAQLKALAERMEAYETSGTTQDALVIGRTLGWLESASQAGTVVSAVHQSYGHPNVYASISQRLVSAGFEEHVAEVSPIRDNILGTSIRGTANMNGNVSADVLSSQGRAAVRLRLSGIALSSNVGTNRGVSICTNGTTCINAGKTLYLSASGITDSTADAQCTTRTHVTGIGARGPLVRKIAQKKVGQQKGQAESIASRRAEQRVSQRMEERSGNLISDANKRYRNKVRAPLERQEAFPQRAQLDSTSDQIHVTLLRRGTFQIAASSPPPPIAGNHDLAVRLHESIVSNMSESLLGGQKLTNEKLAELLREAGREIPEELEVREGTEPWSITFSHNRPLSAEFDNQQVKFSLRGRRFSRGDQSIRRVLDISATYAMEQTPTGLRLVRQGDVSVVFVGRSRLDVAEVAQKRFLLRKFEALFGEEITTDGLVLPGRWAQAGKLYIRQIASHDGWLTLGWQKPSAAASPVKLDSPRLSIR